MTKKYWLIVLLIIAISVVRFWNFPNWFGFDYDQEVNAWLAKSIVIDHKPILIGPETSVGGMYVGPMFNYVIALFYFIGRMNPMATIGLNIIISASTLVILYLIVAKIFSARTGIIAILVYGLSFNLTNFDRVSWNPLPIHLVSLCIVFFLYRFVLTKSLRNLALSSVFVGIFLQLHFTAIFLVAYLFLVLLIFCHKSLMSKPLSLIIVAGILFFFLAPLFLFDIRHDILISTHFMQFIAGSSNPRGTNIAVQVLTVVRIIVDFFKAIVYNEISQVGTILSGLGLATLFVITFIYEKSERRLFLKMCWLLVLIPTILLAFYSGPLPSHYLQFLMPIYVIFIAILVERGMRLKVGRVAAVLIFGLFLLYNVPKILTTNNGLSLQNKMKAVEYIVKDTGSRSFKVDFVTQPGIKTGYKFLFWLNGRELVEDMHIKTENNYKIIIPYYLVKPSDLAGKFGGIGIVKL